MDEERVDAEELGRLASAPFKTEKEIIAVTDEDGYEWELTREIRKFITEKGEIITHKRKVFSKFVTCGHQVSHPSQVMRCKYEGHAVCQHCITFCEHCGELVCLNHSGEYEEDQNVINLCRDCGQTFEVGVIMENRILNRILKIFLKPFTKA